MNLIWIKKSPPRKRDASAWRAAGRPGCGVAPKQPDRHPTQYRNLQLPVRQIALEAANAIATLAFRLMQIPVRALEQVTETGIGIGSGGDTKTGAEVDAPG